MNQNGYWEAVVARDRAYDGRFVYAVRSTGIYCRPSCPSRRPMRQQVRFFEAPYAAERAGYRACKRCKGDPQRDLVARVCEVIDSGSDQPLTLSAISAEVGASPYHLQRTFKRALGISPREYAEARRLKSLRHEIGSGKDVTTAIYEAGYGSSSRLYEGASTKLGMTPGTYRKGGDATNIKYTVVKCRLGWLLVGATERGICAVQLGDGKEALTAAFRKEYPKASIQGDDRNLKLAVVQILDYLDGQRSQFNLPLDVRATAFQRLVWQQLQKIPYGATRSYSDIAQAVGKSGASRAVARACGSNPVALLIPCHRVVRNNGELSGYRWGADRKRALLSRENESHKGTESQR